MKNYRGALWLGLISAASVVLGFVVTSPGVATWDSLSHLDRSLWLVHQSGLPTSRVPAQLDTILKWYGPLWVLMLGILSEVVFPFFHDPSWVQQAFNFALFPVGLVLIYRLLVRAGVKRATALLASALVFGMIRLGGHALVNVNDFPLAMLYLLVTLYTWNRLREIHPAALAHGRYPWTSLVSLGVVSIVPYLVRPPVAPHVLAVCLFLILYGQLVLRPPQLTDRLGLWALPFVSAVTFMWIVWPTVREGGWTGWLHWLASFKEFTSFDMTGRVRLFGASFPTQRLPWWYAFAWLPVILDPLAFVVFLAGLARCFAPGRLQPQSFVLTVGARVVDVSLRRWLAFFTASAWLGVLVVRPVLYDEERQLLFLYPPLLVLAALGLDGLGERLKIGLAALVIASSLASYAGWRRYSYVYKSPLIGNRGADQFMGDYWGACVPPAVHALGGLVPAGTDIVIPSPYNPAVQEYDRLRNGRWSARPGFGPYHLITAPATDKPYAAILYNRLGINGVAIDAANRGTGKLLWTGVMPPGDPACVVIAYPAGTPLPR